MPKALVTGITGQDGSYLTELLIDKGYEVHGLVRRTSTLDRSRLDHLYNNPEIYGKRLFLHYGELSDTTPLRRILQKIVPDEIYHLAGQSHVGLSFEIPETTCEMTALGTLRLLEMVRDLPKAPKFFHASSSEIFGEPKVLPQNEETPLAPVNPYGCAKAYATQMVDVYRRAFSLFAVNGILFNHESPRRGENFVTRKIARAAAAIKLGHQKNLSLGSLTAKRDWGHARDYVEGMWMALQHKEPTTFIFATGKLHSVQDVVEVAFETVGLKWQDYVKQDPRFMRAMEPAQLVGDASKANRLLGWKPKTPFRDLIAEMTTAELQAWK
ncbi:MAG: GDP-mannose 4,6-dehydratase [Limisphaerales bacterium]